MKYSSITLSFVLLLLAAKISTAQCPAGRYKTEMFGVTKSTVTYSTPYSLLMDIYEPAGDVLAERPLIILAHGGSFVAGTRTDDEAVDSLCERFARRGYVTASIDYRLGDVASMLLDSAYAVETVIKAISDGKAAVRYFMKDAATTNTYRIDTNNIYVGGNSAGAVLYMHVGYLSNIAECPPYIASALAANGGFEGNSGNDGYTVKTKAVINLAGALNQTSFVDPTDNPSVNAHGTADDVVPYNCAYPIISGFTIHVNLCGLGALEPVYTANSINHWSMLFPGDGHVPWQSDAVKFNSVDSLVREFLYTLTCPEGAAVADLMSSPAISISPNPASNEVIISSRHEINNIVIYDMTGRQIIRNNGSANKRYQINISNLPKGIYFVSAGFANSKIAPVTERLIVN